MAQTTIQGSFLGDATVTGAKVAADFISAQTALASGLATTDEIIVSDAGVIKRMDISVLEIAATQITASGTLPALNGSNLTALSAANITASGTLPALNGAALTALTAANITTSGTLPALNGAALTALTAANITASGTLPVLNGSALTNLDADDLATGTVPVARLGDGNESNSTFLRGDNTWVAVTGTTINTNADNRVITGSGTANTLNGESTLTFNGTTLTTPGQIAFPASVALSSNANTLDDYQEGTFTPTAWDWSFNDSEATYLANRVGRYVKIGRWVYFNCKIGWSSIGTLATGSQLLIGGLPYASMTGTNHNYAACFGHADGLGVTAGTSVSGTINAGTSYISAAMWSSTGGTSSMNWSNGGPNPNASMTISGMYETNS